MKEGRRHDLVFLANASTSSTSSSLLTMPSEAEEMREGKKEKSWKKYGRHYFIHMRSKEGGRKAKRLAKMCFRHSADQAAALKTHKQAVHMEVVKKGANAKNMKKSTK